MLKGLLDLTPLFYCRVIPPALGKLLNLYWLDLADNQLSGSIPTSTIAPKGLNSLKKAKNLMFDGNWLGGSIPDSIAKIQTLEVLRLDRNGFEGKVLANLQNLGNVVEL
ncbi:hypothetical protein AgCh_005369 [Apium graveolens]